MAAAAAGFKVHRLELLNFKSYQGKVAVGPFEDFTCIVGPNGSGKSNLMDALSFVLGATAVAMRSANFAELINKKAKKRECAVTLVMKSPDGNEKTFTRSVNATGAVEHAVDGIRCGEKDFSGALRKLKLSARLSTFLVFQHEVDSIAQKKAKDLTELIEQVSGSGELKAEYEACRKNLEATNKGLMEAAQEKRGAQFELQQLKLHKVEAEKYSDLQLKFASERRDLAVAELFYIETQLTRQKDKLSEQTAVVQSLGDKTDDAATLKKEYAKKHQAYLEELKKSRAVGAKLRDNRTTLERVKASVSHFTAKLARQQAQLGSVNDHAAARNKEVARLEDQLVHHEKAFAIVEAKWKEDDVKSNKFAALSPADLDEYRKLRRDADCATITERQSLDTLRRQRDAVAESTKDVKLQVDRVEGAQADLEAGLAAISDKRSALQTRIDEIDKEAADVRAKLEDHKAEVMQGAAARKEREDEIAKVDAALRELRFTKEENRHGQRVAEALDSLRQLFPGVKGRFTDLCAVKDNKYKFAVTVAFGQNMDAVIVDTTETAMACVRYLKEQRIASLSFIPLNNVSGKAVTDEWRTLGGTARPLVDVLKYDAALEPAVRFAVGQTVVCDSLAEARKVAYGASERRKVVTIDGAVLQKSGAVQGGLASVQARASKWDEKHYDALKARREALAGSGAGADATTDDLRAKQRGRELQTRLDAGEATKKRLAEELALIEKKLTAAPEERKRLQAQHTTHDSTLKSLAAKLKEIDRDIEKKAAEVAAAEEAIYAPFQKRVGLSNVAELERETVRRDRARAEQRNQFAVVKHKLKTAIDAEKQRTGEASSEELRKAVDQTAKELETCNSDLGKVQNFVARDTKSFADAQAAVTTLKADLDKIEAQIRDKGRATEADAMKHSTARKQLTMLQAACESLRAQRANIYQRCRMEDIDLPIAEGAAAGSSKRGRDTDLAPGDASGLIIRTSEVFSPSSAGAGDGKARKSGLSETVAIDFAAIPKAVREVAKSGPAFQKFKADAEAEIEQIAREMDTLAPNLKATTHMQTSEAKVGQSSSTLDQAKEKSMKAAKDFARVKELRTSRFMHTFQLIVDHVDSIYRDLTMGTRAHDVHGSAYLALENAEEPYRGGTRYHATPPMKRYMEMEQLSGGERTMAAMALLFAIHATSPTPFFVLDEVDAALDVGNVAKLAHYIRTHAGPSHQFIVVSLKEQLYNLADSLIGVFKDTARESSSTMSMDLRALPAAAASA